MVVNKAMLVLLHSLSLTVIVGCLGWVILETKTVSNAMMVSALPLEYKYPTCIRLGVS